MALVPSALPLFLAGPILRRGQSSLVPRSRTPPDQRNRLVIVPGSSRLMFATPPLEADPANDGVFPPPGGWRTREPSPSDPVPKAQPEDAFPHEDYPTIPKRDGMLSID